MQEKIRTLIVDDEPKERRRVRRLLEEDPEIEVIGECASGRETVEAIQAHHPDLVFLDVEMRPGINGFEALALVDETKMPLVIFVTGYDEYALRAFDLHPIDYLLKPYDEARFQAALAQAKRSLRTEQLAARYAHIISLLEEFKGGPPAGHEPSREERTEFLLVKEHDRERLLKVSSIDWIKAEDKYVSLHVSGEPRVVHHEAISSLAKRLDPKQFLRIHRSYLVNINSIREIIPWFHRKYKVLLHDGTELSMSRSRHKRLFESR
ncbi:MAG: response regulator transcription factor [Acidobacteria bacterium]|nr:response regulator transcription factor [Acidobacteriota bacterium]